MDDEARGTRVVFGPYHCWFYLDWREVGLGVWFTLGGKYQVYAVDGFIGPIFFEAGRRVDR